LFCLTQQIYAKTFKYTNFHEKTSPFPTCSTPPQKNPFFGRAAAGGQHCQREGKGREKGGARGFGGVTMSCQIGFLEKNIWKKLVVNN